MNWPVGALFGSFVATYVAAYVFGAWDDARTRRAHRRLLRLTSVVLLCSALWIWLVVAAETDLKEYTAAITLGMACCVVGDLITGGIIPSRKPYIVAAGAFGIGHIAYFVAVHNVARYVSSMQFGTWVAVGGGAGAIAWTMFIRRLGDRSALNVISLAYALLLGSLLGGALCVARNDARFWMLGIGMAFFTISDILLGNRELRKNQWYLMYDVIWALYITGQFLIVWSAFIRLQTGS